MKWPWNCISWNALKEKFHSVSFPLDIYREYIAVTLVLEIVLSLILFVYLCLQKRHLYY